MSATTTAILLFSRTASAEAEQKSFGAGTAGLRITSALIARTEKTLARTSLPVFRSDENSQTGAGFGERLAGAMAAVYDRGYERLLVVGNDCPSLTSRHLRAAAQMLESGQNVIGPDRRGGVWLIGLQRADFNAKSLGELSWETGDLHADLGNLLPDVADFAPLADLNTFEDLRNNWYFLRCQLQELFDLLHLAETAFSPPAPQPEPVAIMRRLGRAPPR